MGATTQRLTGKANLGRGRRRAGTYTDLSLREMRLALAMHFYAAIAAKADKAPAITQTDNARFTVLLLVVRFESLSHPINIEPTSRSIEKVRPNGRNTKARQLILRPTLRLSTNRWHSLGQSLVVVSSAAAWPDAEMNQLRI